MREEVFLIYVHQCFNICVVLCRLQEEKLDHGGVNASRVLGMKTPSGAFFL